jgi:hypothetical protein
MEIKNSWFSSETNFTTALNYYCASTAAVAMPAVYLNNNWISAEPKDVSKDILIISDTEIEV